jgi:hypothetical protein
MSFITVQKKFFMDSRSHLTQNVGSAHHSNFICTIKTDDWYYFKLGEGLY